MNAREFDSLTRYLGERRNGNKNAKHFDNDLVEALAQMIPQRWKPDPAPEWICCVPSKNHPDLVPDFATRLATQLELPCIDAIIKVKNNHPQKAQQNRFHQCQNLDGAFEITLPVPDGPALLVDDIIGSGWTLTVLAALLLQAGSGPVYPVALASSSVND